MIDSLYSLLNLERRKVLYFSILITEKICILIFHFFIANYFSSESYGILNQTNFISAFFQNILMFGVAIPFIVSVAGDKNLHNLFFKFFIPLSIFVSFFSFLVILLFSEFFTNIIFGNPLFIKYLTILFIIIVSDILSEYIIVRNRVEDKLQLHSNFILSRSLIKVSILLIIYFFTNDFFISFLISSISYLIFTLVVSHLYFDLSINNYINILKNDFNQIKKLLIDGFQFILIYILSTTSSILINLIIVSEFDINTLAIYNFNFMLASAPITILGYITFYSLPDFSKKVISSDNIISSNLFKDILLTSLLFLIFFVIIYFAYDLIIFVINEFYRDKTLFSIIFISNFIFMINNFCQFPLLSKKKYVPLITIIFISLSLNLIYLFIINDNFTLLTPVYGFLIANISAFILLVITNFSNYHKL